MRVTEILLAVDSDGGYIAMTRDEGCNSEEGKDGGREKTHVREMDQS